MAALPTLQEIKERLASHDHSGVIELAQLRLAEIPEDDVARGYLDRAVESLTQAYMAPFGGLQCRVRVTMPVDILARLDIDHRAAFLVSRIEEPTSIEDLISISGMSQLETLHHLNDLLEQRVIEVDS